MFNRELHFAESTSTKNGLRINLESETELSDLKLSLKNILGTDGADQFVFVLKTMSFGDFENHCNEATQELGRRLNTKFGGEESFFDIVPNANFYDVRSEKPLTKINYTGNFHSVGVIEIRGTGNKLASLSIDLTYNRISPSGERRSILVINTNGGISKALEDLQDHYGGLWGIIYNFNKKNSLFVFQE